MHRPGPVEERQAPQARGRPPLTGEQSQGRCTRRITASGLGTGPKLDDVEPRHRPAPYVRRFLHHRPAAAAQANIIATATELAINVVDRGPRPVVLRAA